MALFYTEIKGFIIVKRYLLTFFVLLIFFTANSQTNKVDSFNRLLNVENIDSNRVKLLLDLANHYVNNLPDSSYYLSQRALSISKAIKFADGESRALISIANYFTNVGNYPRALEFYLKKLKFEENRKNSELIATANISLAGLYYAQEDYDKALKYSKIADSILEINKAIDEWKLINLTNIGEYYYRLNKLDSALYYLNNVNELATEKRYPKVMEKYPELKGVIYNNLGNAYSKLKDTAKAKVYFYKAIACFVRENIDDMLCETSIGLANLFDKSNKDSSEFYAVYSMSIAKKAGFKLRELEAYTFLTKHYKEINNIDSAFVYQEKMIELKDVINSKDKLKEVQIMSLDEDLRQKEILDNIKKEKEEYSKRLQLLLIGISIPIVFLLTLFLNKKKIHPKVIRFMGIISLLLLFEYLTLLLHPFVLEITNHTPVFEIIIFVCIAAILVPAHHKIQNWLIERITHKVVQEETITDVESTQ